MWTGGHFSLIVSMIEESLQAEGFGDVPTQKIEQMAHRFYAGEPMPDLSGPELLVRSWLADGMPELGDCPKCGHHNLTWNGRFICRDCGWSADKMPEKNNE